MSSFLRTATIGLACLTLVCIPVVATARSNPPAAKLTKAFKVIRDNYVAPIDMVLLADAAVAGIQERAGVDAPIWDACIQGPARPGSSKKSPPPLTVIQNALGCAVSDQRDRAKIDALIDAAILAMVKKLDDRSSWLDAKMFEAASRSVFEKRASLGLSLTLKDGALVVVRTGARTPSREAGILAGDEVLAIDGVSAASMSLDDAIERCKGAIASPATFTLKRGREPAWKVEMLRREITALDSALNVERHGNVLVAEVSALPSKVSDALQGLIVEKLPMTRAVILDLRDNSGGLLDQAVSTADAFLASGTLGELRGRTAQDFDVWHATPGQVAEGLPLIILANSATASGAEIIASTLQDHKRAIVVGQKTFGAGAVQTLFPVSKDSALRLTTSYEYRPNGQRLADAPVVPDCPTDLEGADLLKLALTIAENGGKSCSAPIELSIGRR